VNKFPHDYGDDKTNGCSRMYKGKIENDIKGIDKPRFNPANSMMSDRKKQRNDETNNIAMVLRFVLFVPALLYAMFDYYVFTLTFVLARIASSLFDDTL